MTDNRNSIPRWISLLYRYGQMYIGEHLKEYEIGRGQHIFINALYREDGLTQEELADHLKIDKGTTAKALKKLEEQGYITRTVSEKDKRCNEVHLTDKALLIKEDVRKVLTDWRERLTYGMSDEEKALALTILEKMGTNAARFAEEPMEP
ncbi:MarR family transcriptional regulator [Paenibacillus sp. HWE-109]|uniref:MarR family winged helix-turn-helix transcriptional regulator n=1 Tax=Paenibacillus sp. HWE-109 TaxID=1306526 RepID=UPI001EDEA43E|nr:MarR family transcriptional regulator [Paenibacillus sp. HWE-109]UKS27844.1 MarR family transcriptional regulator [Paenibacillus sp. HWE-109]